MGSISRFSIANRLGATLACAAAALFTGLALCAPPPSGFRTEVLYRGDRLTSEEFSAQTLMIMPLFNAKGFNTDSALSPLVLKSLLLALRTDLVVYFKEDFEQRFLQRNSKSALTAFYKHLFASETVALQTSDSAWASMPARYVLAIRIISAGRVRDFHGTMQREVRLEAELWNVENAEVVERIGSRGTDPDVKTSDADYIKLIVQEVYKQLPAYKPALHEQGW
jgi:hypothetical protein